MLLFSPKIILSIEIPIDDAVSDYLAIADTSDLGIEKDYYFDDALSNRCTPIPIGKTVALTQEPVNDTIWIYGNFEGTLIGLSLGAKPVDNYKDVQ